MNKELQRQAVKGILKELSDNAIPFSQLAIKAMQEGWEEERLSREMAALLTPEALSKNFDYYTDRIVKVFQDA